jgi:DNA-directed RNA polymerase alpha subunit
MKHLKKYSELEEINEVSKELASRAAIAAKNKIDKLQKQLDIAKRQYHTFSSTDDIDKLVETMNIDKDKIVNLTRRSYNCAHYVIRWSYDSGDCKIPYFTKLGDITQLTEKIILKYRRFGMVTVNNIKDCLKSYGLELGLDLDELGIIYDKENHKYVKKQLN